MRIKRSSVCLPHHHHDCIFIITVTFINAMEAASPEKLLSPGRSQLRVKLEVRLSCAIPGVQSTVRLSPSCLPLLVSDILIRTCVHISKFRVSVVFTRVTDVCVCVCVCVCVRAPCSPGVSANSTS